MTPADAADEGPCGSLTQILNDLARAVRSNVGGRYEAVVDVRETRMYTVLGLLGFVDAGDHHTEALVVTVAQPLSHTDQWDVDVIDRRSLPLQTGQGPTIVRFSADDMNALQVNGRLRSILEGWLDAITAELAR